MFKKLFTKNQQSSLEKKYRKLMEEAHRLSHQDRQAADRKIAEAQAVIEQLDKLKS